MKKRLISLGLALCLSFFHAQGCWALAVDQVPNPKNYKAYMLESIALGDKRST